MFEGIFLHFLSRESLRLNPVSVGVGRILPQDTLLGGYMVPKGTVCVTQNQVGRGVGGGPYP